MTGSVGGNVTGSVGSLATQAKADVNAEVVDVLVTDTFTEPGQGAPGVSISLAAKIGFLYKAFRNRLTQTSTTLSVYADDGVTVDQKSTVSDDSVTYTRGSGEWAVVSSTRAGCGTRARTRVSFSLLDALCTKA